MKYTSPFQINLLRTFLEREIETEAGELQYASAMRRKSQEKTKTKTKSMTKTKT